MDKITYPVDIICKGEVVRVLMTAEQLVELRDSVTAVLAAIPSDG